MVAAHFLLAAQTLISRGQDPTDPAVLTFGRIEAGTAANVIPERATLSGTVRTISERSRSRLEEGMRCIGRSYGRHRVRTRVPGSRERSQSGRPFPGSSRLRAWGRERGTGNARDGQRRLLLLFRGHPRSVPQPPIGRPGKDFPHHHPRFDIEEGALPLGVDLWLQLIGRFNGSP